MITTNKMKLRPKAFINNLGNGIVARGNQMAVGQADTENWNLPDHRKCMRKFRKSGRVSLDELASAANLSKSTLSRYETGKTELSPESWSKLSSAMQNLPAKRRLTMREAELSLKKELSIGFIGELLGHLKPLSSLVTAGAERHEQKVKEGRDKMQRVYGPHWEEVFGTLFDLARTNKDLVRRVAELRDLLALETEAGVKASEADSLRETIKLRDREKE